MIGTSYWNSINTYVTWNWIHTFDTYMSIFSLYLNAIQFDFSNKNFDSWLSYLDELMALSIIEQIYLNHFWMASRFPEKQHKKNLMYQLIPHCKISKKFLAFRPRTLHISAWLIFLLQKYQYPEAMFLVYSCSRKWIPILLLAYFKFVFVFFGLYTVALIIKFNQTKTVVI